MCLLLQFTDTALYCILKNALSAMLVQRTNVVEVNYRTQENFGTVQFSWIPPVPLQTTSILA